MNINFHYFTIKALASYAGFSESEAQTIAAYSQFVDDYNLYDALYLTKVPDYALFLSQQVLGGYLFSPVATAIPSSYDTTLLSRPDFPIKTAIPFHYIPNRPLNSQSESITHYRTQASSFSKPCLITDMLLEAKMTYLSTHNTLSLMYMGMLLHIFADTYAHQNFNGYHSYENFSFLTNATSNINDSEITYLYLPSMSSQMYAIGHNEVSHAPDDTFLSFEMSYSNSNSETYPEEYSLTYQRNNSTEFLIAAKEILSYLRSVKLQSELNTTQWNSLSALLLQGFLTSSTKIQALSSHWQKLFPTYQFYYSKESMLDQKFHLADSGGPVHFESIQKQSPPLRMQCQAAEFFAYNMLAYQIQTRVNGVSLPNTNSLTERNTTSGIFPTSTKQ